MVVELSKMILRRELADDSHVTLGAGADGALAIACAPHPSHGHADGGSAMDDGGGDRASANDMLEE